MNNMLYASLIILKAQLTNEVLKLLEDNNVDVVCVPANYTNCLKLLDLSVNKPMKDFLKGKFELWHSDQMFEQRFQVSHALGAQWMMDVYHYIQTHPEIIKNVFQAAGII